MYHGDIKYSQENYRSGICTLRNNLQEFDRLYDIFGEIEYGLQEFNFHSLVRTIAGQQLSGKAAATIFGRLQKLEGSDVLTPEFVTSCGLEKLRETGLSNAKASYILDIANKTQNDEFSFERMLTLGREECFVALTGLRGIGPWSASIMMMFRLGFLDEFPKDDVTLCKAINSYFPDLTEERLEECASPYRSILALYLWHYIDEFVNGTMSDA